MLSFNWHVTCDLPFSIFSRSMNKKIGVRGQKWSTRGSSPIQTWPSSWCLLKISPFATKRGEYRRHKGATTVLKWGGPSAEGASRDAEGAEGEGVFPSPVGKGSEEKAVPLLRIFFDFFIWKWWVLVHRWRFRAVCSYCTREWGRRKRKSPGEGRHSALIGERPIHQILYFHQC